MGGSTKESVATSIISGLCLLVFVMVLAVLAKGGKSDVEVTAAHVSEATERKQDVRPENRLALRSPIGLELCSATMGSGYHRHRMERSKERCYIARGKK